MSKLLLPKRYVTVIMCFWGIVVMYSLRVNLNIAIGAMVNEHILFTSNGPETVASEFNWTRQQQGQILGSFYYGYASLQIVGGWLAMKYQATTVFGCSILVSSILTLFTPLMARIGSEYLILLRILEGIFLSCVIPSNIQIWSKWAPNQEKSFLISITLTGVSIGSIITMPLTGLLTKYGFDGGWASVFYTFGTLGILWWFIWFLVVHESPSVHPTISIDERLLVENNSNQKQPTDVPWLKILSSKAVFGIAIGNFTSDWGLYSILICIPIFVLDILKMDISTMGFVVTLPFILRTIIGPLSGYLADRLIKNGYGVLNVRRLFFLIGSLPTAVCLVSLSYFSNYIWVIVLLCIGSSFTPFLHSSYDVNVVDIAPSYCGIVIAITNTFGTLSGFLSPILVGFLTPNKSTEEWRIFFWITGSVYLLGAIFYCYFISGEIQSWALDKQISVDDENQSSTNHH